MSAMASQITGVSIVCSTVGPGADQTKHQSSASLPFVRGIHRWPANSPNKRAVTRKMFPFDDVIMPYFKVHGADMIGYLLGLIFPQPCYRIPDVPLWSKTVLSDKDGKRVEDGFDILTTEAFVGMSVFNENFPYAAKQHEPEVTWNNKVN